MKMTVAVLFGSRTVEHEVSVISALQCIEAMDTDKYTIIPVYISKDGVWYTGEALRHVENYKDLNKLCGKCKKVLLSHNAGEHILFAHTPGVLGRSILARLDVIFPIFHGTNGEDGTMQGLFDLMNIPYVGCNLLSSALCMDKIIMKSVFRENGLPMLEYMGFHGSEWLQDREAVIEKIEGKFNYPIIVKPANLGSSIGVVGTSNCGELEEAIDTVVGLSNYVIVERQIKNLKEVNCSILGDHEQVEASICEEPLTAADILTFQDKYVGGSKTKGGSPEGMSGAQRKIPAEISEKMTKMIQELAQKAFLALNCSGVVRFDFLIDQDSGELYINEPNTIPGSLAFYLWEPSGVPYPKLVDKLIYLALKQFREKSNLIFTYPTNILGDFSVSGAKGAKGAKGGKMG